MKTDLDRLMDEKEVVAMIIFGKSRYNPNMAYLVQGATLSYAMLIKAIKREPILFHHTMERGEASQSGLKTKDLSDYDWSACLQAANGSQPKAQAHLLAQILTELGITKGKVLISGTEDIGKYYIILNTLNTILPQLTLLGEEESTNALLQKARLTKDANEIQHIRHIGQITTAIVGEIVNFLTSHKVKHGILIQPNYEPLTIGEVKKKIRILAAELGAEFPEGFILSTGYDTAIPHNSGRNNDVIAVGVPLLLDIFPCDMNSGYFYDFTRTWCLGYAPDEVYALYEDVRQVYQEIKGVISNTKNLSCREIQIQTCELFELRNHPTILSDRRTTQGFVHGLGHGVGLNIHEAPPISLLAAEHERILPRTVFTIEPGLYYPPKKIGIRLEDTYWIQPDGKLEQICDYPDDLVLPMS